MERSGGAGRDATVGSARTLGPDEGLATLAAESAQRPALDREAAHPATIGRHLMLERLGAGAMGIVYSAYDPELDRKLAIKVIAAQPGSGEDISMARTRVLREAQAMARVAHPGVVQIFDVGTHEGKIFLAMELVDGETLGAWLRRERPSWRQVVDVFVQAGRGLEAAHQAGLVHRDFKPDNVLIDRAGRVRVADFGLARAADPGPTPLSSIAGLASERTQAGLVGTPAYMAPELLRGQAADARSDIYAFCVALFEALYGQRPFRADSIPALFTTILAGVAVEPRGVRLPGWLRRTVLRGIASDPNARFKDMRELLAALTEIPARRRRLLIGAAVGALCSVLGVSLLSGASTPICEGSAAPLVGVWDAPRRSALAARFAASERAHATATWDAVARAIDGYTADWAAMRTSACEAAQLRGEQSLALMDRRMACLDQRLNSLRRLLEIVEESDAAILDAGPSIIAGLRPLDRCANVEALLADVPPPDDPGLAAAVAEERDRLARVDGLIHTSRTADAALLAAEITRRARIIDYAPLLAEALVAQGHALRLDRGEGSLAALQEAYVVAERGGHDRARLTAAIDLITVLAPTRDFEVADAWSLVAGAISERRDDPELRVLLERGRGILAFHRGDLALAEDHFKRTLAGYRALHGDRHPDVAAILSNLGGVLSMRGRHEDAEAALRESVAVIEASFGPEHPLLANTLQNLGATLENRSRFREATEILANRELPLRIAALGPDHPIVRERTFGLGLAWTRLGEDEAALAAYARCLDGAAPVATIEFRVHLARCGLLAGRDEAARLASCGRALELLDAAIASPSWQDALEPHTVLDTLTRARVPADALVVAPTLAAVLAAARKRDDTVVEIRALLADAGRHTVLGQAEEAAARIAAARDRLTGLDDPTDLAALSALVAETTATAEAAGRGVRPG